MSLESTGVIGRAEIDVSDSGDTEIVSSLSGYRIRVLSFVLVPSGAVSVKWKGSSDLTGAMALAANTPLEASPSPWGHVETAVDSSLSLNLSGAVQVSGFLTYQYVV